MVSTACICYLANLSREYISHKREQTGAEQSQLPLRQRKQRLLRRFSAPCNIEPLMNLQPKEVQPEGEGSAALVSVVQ